ncbi:MAG: RHS repeat-associated core domain-containing protein [Verrucomicrobiota bacterium JB022]|nr:RHS repeat-associated core domain-containing protein [Verrucomicrobiota bacterium JB022]
MSATGRGTLNAYLYTGEQWDADLGMYFLRARYLNPDTGRFHTLDTYEGSRSDPQTLHKYLYAHANPVMGVDPSGMFTLAERIVVAAVIGTMASVTVGAVGLNRVIQHGWHNPDVYFGGVRGRIGGSTSMGVGYALSLGGIALWDKADLYLSVAGGATVSFFSAPGKVMPKPKGLESMFGMIWGKGVSSGFGFSGFTSYFSAGALRVALIGLKSVIPEQVVESLRTVAMAIQRSGIEARISITPSMTSDGVAASFSVFQGGKAGNSPIGIGVLSFRGAVNVCDTIDEFGGLINDFNRYATALEDPEKFIDYVRSFNY